MRLLLRHKLLVGVLAVVVAAGAAGGAYAATQSSSSPQQAYLKDAAKRLHVSPAKLRSALKGALIDRLNAMVKAGQLTQAQAKKIEQGFGKGGHFFGGPGFFGGHRGSHLGMRIGVKAAASYLGLSETKLMTDLGSGKSLAQVATSQGKSVTGLEQAITTAEKARLDKLVSKGVLTSAQEQKTLGRLSARIDKLVNHSFHMTQWHGRQNGPMMTVPGAGGAAGGALGSGPASGSGQSSSQPAPSA